MSSPRTGVVIRTLASYDFGSVKKLVPSLLVIATVLLAPGFGVGSRGAFGTTSGAATSWVGGSVAHAQPRVLQIAYTPTKRAQVALWIESSDGTFLATLMLTEAVGRRGIGNRPGAMQMNSGFRHPYGRREGVLPIWAHRRASALGALQFPRVIFQRRIEGYASGGNSTEDPYYCLSFSDQRNDDIDAVTCASVFSSDKGRLLTNDDVANGYGEPFEAVPGTSTTRVLSLTSLYPMRHDFDYLPPIDAPESATFDTLVRAVMPDIDVVTRATAPADSPQLLTFTLPADWPDGDYVVWFEVNTERDLNATYSEAAHPTPIADTTNWDTWSTYGYAYRGQPSVLYRVPVHLDAMGGTWTVDQASGYGELHGLDGDVRPLDATITDDPIAHPGSGVDRLRRVCDTRISVSTVAFAECEDLPVVPAVSDLEAAHVSDPKHSHEWARLRFTAVGLEDGDASGYQVKISTRPITTVAEFDQAEYAKAASGEIEGVELCPVGESDPGTCPPTTGPDCPDAGTVATIDIGRLAFQTHYYVAIRAVGRCGVKGPITSAEFETTAIDFTTVAPCFVATAAHGSTMAPDVETLRAFRNDVLMTTGVGRAFVAAYYSVGPSLAALVDTTDARRAIARALLRPFVQASDHPGAPARASAGR